MKIALIGYGKMGRAIERLAPEYGGEVVLRLDEFNNQDFAGITAGNFRGVDVAIDFSIPSAVVENASRVAGLNVNLVIGTTGWTDRLDEVRALAVNCGIVWSPNYSIGVNAFFRLA